MISFIVFFIASLAIKLSRTDRIPEGTPWYRRFNKAALRAYKSGEIFEKAINRYMSDYSVALERCFKYYSRQRFTCLWGQPLNAVSRHFITKKLSRVIDAQALLSFIKFKDLRINKNTGMPQIRASVWLFISSIYMITISLLLLCVFTYFIFNFAVYSPPVLLKTFLIYGFLVFSLYIYYYHGIRQYFLIKKYKPIIDEMFEKYNL